MHSVLLPGASEFIQSSALLRVQSNLDLFLLAHPFFSLSAGNLYIQGAAYGALHRRCGACLVCVESEKHFPFTTVQTVSLILV